MSESTESKMLDRYNTVIGAATPMDAIYNPPGSIASVAAMTAKSAEGQAALDALDIKEAEEEMARNLREQLYERLAPLGSDVYKYSKLLGWSEADMAFLQSKVRELRGGRAEARPVDDPATPDVDESDTGGSSAQLSYASLEGTWSEIVAFLTEKGFQANESEMKLAALTALRDELRAANIAVANADGAAAQARQLRDEIFYLAPDSIYHSARAAKNYLSAIHEDSQAWAAVKNLEFRLPPRLR